MKNLKNLAVILTVLFFTSCKSSPIIGSWFCDQKKPFSNLTFEKDNGYMATDSINNITSNFDYILADDKLTLKANFGDKQMKYTIGYNVVKLTADSLVLNFGNDTLIYNRIK